MAETIKGINVVIGAETTGLSKALSDVNKKSKDIQSELRQVEQLLKLDPGNTELLAQKQKLLSDAVSNTAEKLDRLKSAQQQVNEQFSKGEISEGQYRAFQRELAKTEQELKSLDGKLDETTASLKEQGVAVSQLGKDYQESFDQAKQSMGNSFEQMKKVGAGITAAGAGIAAGLGIAVKGAMDFEQGMANAFSVMAPEEISEFRGELEELAIQLGADTKYSATEAAKGIEELIKAGVSVQDVLDGGLSGALSLATAGELELADAAEIASTALNAFKDDALSVQEAADILAGGANASATSVSELKFGLAQSASVASSVGLSFMDTATALSVFAQNGLKGSDAGTSLKTMLMRLQPATKAQIEEFERLDLMSYDVAAGYDYLVRNGIKPASDSFEDVDAALKQHATMMSGAKEGSEKAQNEYTKLILQTGVLTSRFYDATGSLKGMDEIAGLLQESFTGMTDAQRQASMQILFGTDAIRAGNILYKEGADGINNMAEAMSKISADDVAAQKLNTFNGALEELSGSIETAQISIGQALIPALRAITGVIQSVVDGFNSLPAGFKSFIAIAGAVAAAAALIVGPLIMLVGFIPQIAAGFAVIVPTIKAFGVAISAVAGPITLIVAGIAALTAGLIYLYNTNETVRNALNAAWEGIKSAAVSIFGAIKDFWATWGDSIISFFREIWALISDIFSAVLESIGMVVREVFFNIKKFWETWGADITAFFTGAWNIISSVFSTAIEVIAKVVRAVFDEIKGFWDKWGSDIMASFRRICSIVITVFTETFNLVFSTVKAIFEKIKSFWDTWGATITNVFKTLLNVLKTMFEGTWNAIKIVIDTVLGVIKHMIMIWAGIFEGDWESVWENVKNIVKIVWDGIKNLFSNAFETMKNIGKNIGEGLLQGIANMKDAIVNKAKEIANSVGDAVKDFFGIASPSKLMKGYGENIGEGLAIGISRSGIDAVRSAKNTAGAVADALSVSVNGKAGVNPSVNGANGANSYNFEGMFAGANFNVRNDNDIKLIAREIFTLQQTAIRGAGF